MSTALRQIKSIALMCAIIRTEMTKHTMHSPTALQRYSNASIALHWVTVLLLVGVYVCIEGRGYFPRGSAIREGLKAWHFSLGLTVFGLTWLRLALRWFGMTPAITPSLPAWQMLMSRLAHGVLYLCMLALPLAGWMMLSAAGKPIPLFGIELPALLAPDKALAKTIEEVHETVGTALLYVIGIHALAGLYHHYIRRDNTLARISWLGRR